uniref:Olfactory receptor n=1 Tax=Mastacembelus armatus TaxID=205130 RepID=A0A3Q3M2M6_9TELE
MRNFSEVTYFYLSDFYEMENYKSVYFFIFLIIYVIIVAENVALLLVVYHEKILHEPMYLLLCNLAVNGLYGSTALLPAILSKVLSHSYEISLPLCQTQIFALHTYAIVEFTILAVMSYDRYMAICYPLPYHAIMSQRLGKLIVFTWLYPMLAFLSVFIFTLQIRFCERKIEKVHCSNYSLVKLACTDTSILNIVGLLSVVLYTLPQLMMIFYSYAHILRICILSVKKSKLKALRTCTPHLLAVINYSIGCLFEIAQTRLNSKTHDMYRYLCLSSLTTFAVSLIKSRSDQ